MWQGKNKMAKVKTTKQKTPKKETKEKKQSMNKNNVDYKDWFIQFHKWFSNDIQLVRGELTSADAEDVFNTIKNTPLNWVIIEEYVFAKNKSAIKNFKEMLTSCLVKSPTATKNQLKALCKEYPYEQAFIISVYLLYKNSKYRGQLATKFESTYLGCHEPQEPSKELRAILDAISAYMEKHDSDAQVLFSILAFDKSGDKVIDDTMRLFGVRECLKISMDSFNEEIYGCKEDFVNVEVCGS